MAKLHKLLLLVLVTTTMLLKGEASAPFFLQAIASALNTIPFTAGPMTGGLVGAKLAVGSKLLYYLGFFGRRRSKTKSAPVATSPAKQSLGSTRPKLPAGMQAIPLPYAFGGGPNQFGGGFGGGNPNFFGQYPYGYDPAQLYQMLAAQGIDPMTAMNFEGMPASQAVPASQFPFTAGKFLRNDSCTCECFLDLV